MNEDYDTAISFVLQWEGGFVNHPADHGGPTMKGVTQSVYDKWRSDHGEPRGDVSTIADDELNFIYRQNYWDATSCDALRAHLDLVTFDTAVNMGPVRAVKILQRVLSVGEDGKFGSQTRQACDACDPEDAVKRYCEVREAIYRELAEAPNQSVFLAGWLNRLNALRVKVGLPGTLQSHRGVGEQPAAHIDDLAVLAPLDI